MNRNLNQNQFIFASAEINPPGSWRSQIVSATVHIVAVIILLLIPVAVTRNPQVIRTITTFIVPPLKQYKPKVEPPKVEHRKVLAKVEIPLKLTPRPKPQQVVAPPVAQQTPKMIER